MSERLSGLLKRAKARVAAMSPEEYAAMIEAQRQSWVRAMAPCERPDCRRALSPMDRERENSPVQKYISASTTIPKPR
jgi:hypothetical protein